MKEDKLKYIGQTFGKLTIKEILPFYKKVRNTQQIDYKCKIHCGFCNKDGVIHLYGLLANKIKSCGCQRYISLKGLNNKKCKNLTGQRFNHLVAIEIDKLKTSRIFWKCKCDCGNFTSVATKHLTSNIAKSCGCSQFQLGKFSNSWKGFGEISGKYWGNIYKSSINRKLEFSISIEYIWKLFLKQNKKCALTGVELKFNSRNDSIDGNASLDRIDSNKGYIEGNVQWVDKKINTIKWDLNLDNFFKTCKLVVEYNKL